LRRQLGASPTWGCRKMMDADFAGALFELVATLLIEGASVLMLALAYRAYRRSR
jgi:hypothetical protein